MLYFEHAECACSHDGSDVVLWSCLDIEETVAIGTVIYLRGSSDDISCEKLAVLSTSYSLFSQPVSLFMHKIVLYSHKHELSAVAEEKDV